MNIFVLDEDIEQCARYHCDQHVVKMILESAQIACTALNLHGFTTPFKSTHVQHPCVRWATASQSNLEWLVQLARALNREYRFRYDKDKDHASIAVLDQIEQMRFATLGLTEFPQAMPEQYRVTGDPVTAYRNFYVGEKMRFARWTKRSVPEWITGVQAEAHPDQDAPV